MKTTEYCGICHIRVESENPERKVVVDKVYHESCILRNLRAKRQEEILQEQERQTVWNGGEGLTRYVQ